MWNIVNVKPELLLQRDPLELAEFFRQNVEIKIPASIDTDAEKRTAIQEMNKVTSYICYFKELETVARIYKREEKRKGCSAKEADRLIGCEEVVEAFKRICEQCYEQLSKLMTMKRLMLEETKMLGKMI